MKLFLILLTISISLLASPVGKWENTQQKIKIEFKKNGKFTWQINQKLINGTWKQKNAQVIQTYVSNGVAEYGFMVKGNMLGLVANNGAQMYLTKVGFSKVDNKVLGTWYSTDGKFIYKFKFNKNGVYSITANKQTIKGTWGINGKILTTNINKQTTHYSYGFKNNFLILAQTKTNYMSLSKDRKYTVNLKKQMQKASQGQKQNIVQQKGFLSNKEFLYLLQNYATMNPNIVYNYLTRFNKNQQSWIPIYQAWYGMMVFRACQGTSAYVRANDKQMCANAKKSYLNTMNLLKSMPTNMRDPWSNGKSQTTQLMIHYKCKLGLLDNYTCKNHIKIQSGINKITNQNTKTIIKGFEATPCKDHYEQGTNVYLGCY